MSSFQEWLEQNPDEDVSTQITRPLPIPNIPKIDARVLAIDPNCLLCLMEYAEVFGPETLPIEAGGFDLCIDHQEWIHTASPEQLELLRPLLHVLRVRYELAQRRGA